MKDLFGENEGEKIEMRTRLYTSTKKEKTRRKTELTDIDDIDLWRRANGVYELCQCMMSKPERGKSYHILTGGNVVNVRKISHNHISPIYKSSRTISEKFKNNLPKVQELL